MYPYAQINGKGFTFKLTVDPRVPKDELQAPKDPISNPGVIKFLCRVFGIHRHWNPGGQCFHRGDFKVQTSDQASDRDVRRLVGAIAEAELTPDQDRAAVDARTKGLVEQIAELKTSRDAYVKDCQRKADVIKDLELRLHQIGNLASVLQPPTTRIP